MSPSEWLLWMLSGITRQRSSPTGFNSSIVPARMGKPMPMVKFYAGLRKTARINEIFVSASTLRAVLDWLVEQFPTLQQQVWNGKALLPHVIITLNGQTLDLVEGIDLSVAPEDQIAIFPPIAGG